MAEDDATSPTPEPHPAVPAAAAPSSPALAHFASLSSTRLKALLASVGVRHEHCLEKSELLALVQNYPLPFPAAASAALSAVAAAIAALEGPALFAALRAVIGDRALRRDVTARVHALQLRAWRALPAFDGMARHLVEDVHPMFRDGFADVLARAQRTGSGRGGGDVAAFRRINSSLHGHHGHEDADWFPRLRHAHPKLAPEVDVLESDHAALVALEAHIVERRDLDALVEFVAALGDHLNREEMLTVPALMDGTGGL